MAPRELGSRGVFHSRSVVMRMLCVAILVLAAAAAPALGQTPGDRQKARLANKAGWE